MSSARGADEGERCNQTLVGQRCELRCELPIGHPGMHRVESRAKPGLHHRWLKQEAAASPVPDYALIAEQAERKGIEIGRETAEREVERKVLRELERAEDFIATGDFRDEKRKEAIAAIHAALAAASPVPERCDNCGKSMEMWGEARDGSKFCEACTFAAAPVSDAKERLTYDELEQERDRLARELFEAEERLAAAPVSDAKEREKLSRAIGLAESIARIPGLGYEVNKQGVYEIAAEIVELLHAVSGEDR